jgi:hypothetical protein
MNGNGYSLWFLIAYAVGFVAVLCLLWVVLMPERVKTSLKERGFRSKLQRLVFDEHDQLSSGITEDIPYPRLQRLG